LGGCSHTQRHFCTYCACQSSCRGGPALFRCFWCLRLDPAEQYPCCHHEIEGAAEHKAALPLQIARDAAAGLVQACLKVEVAGKALTKVAAAALTASNKLAKLCKAAAPTTEAVHDRAPAAQSGTTTCAAYKRIYISASVQCCSAATITLAEASLTGSVVHDSDAGKQALAEATVATTEASAEAHSVVKTALIEVSINYTNTILHALLYTILYTILYYS
jgi:hypothetical protein